MRHRVYGKHLGRDKNQRTALFRSLVRELFLHESIQTTEPKAKAVKPLVDNLIVKGKKKDNASLRMLTSFLVKPELVKKVTDEIAPRFKDRPSGFTTSVKLGNRAGDGAMLVKMSLIEERKKTVKAEKEEEVVEVAEAIEEATVKEEKPKRAPRKAVKK